MSSSKNNTTYKKTSFLAGSNTEFINQFYADFLSDPESLPKSWRLFFEGLSDEQRLVYEDLKGPSWSPEKKSKRIIKPWGDVMDIMCANVHCTAWLNPVNVPKKKLSLYKS